MENHKDKSWLHQKYAAENLTASEIATLCGVAARTISYWVKKFGLVKLYQDADWLRTKYESGLSTTEIAKLANSDSSTIVRSLKRLDIKSRTVAEGNAAKWQKGEYKYKLLAKLRSDAHRRKLRAIWTDDYREEQQAKQAEVWGREGYRELQSGLQAEVWARPEHREKMADLMASEAWRKKNADARAKMPRVSAIQRVLYSILDDLGVKYYREYEDKPADPECTIGPWTFDCVIPRKGRPSLLIECQGDYFHNLPAERARDKSKATYISTLPGYELKYIWEHEFQNHTKVVELLKYWLGLNQIETVKFGFDEIEIKKCPAEEYRLLLSKYHYLANAGRGGVAYGAYHNGELAAVCVFSGLPRENIEIKPYKKEEARELSRLCIHPKYQVKNFASWFVSRCLKLLDQKYKCIVAYCDTTFNHDGAIYKACNFRMDGEVPADYWYVSGDGWKMHKKTLYNHAIKMGMTEGEFAAANGYRKVRGKKKLRFRYK